jgi:hypothetical protein
VTNQPHTPPPRRGTRQWLHLAVLIGMAVALVLAPTIWPALSGSISTLLDIIAIGFTAGGVQRRR